MKKTYFIHRASDKDHPQRVALPAIAEHLNDEARAIAQNLNSGEFLRLTPDSVLFAVVLPESP